MEAINKFQDAVTLDAVGLTTLGLSVFGEQRPNRVITARESGLHPVCMHLPSKRDGR